MDHIQPRPDAPLVKPAQTARADHTLQQYRRALLAQGNSPKGILKVPHKDPARDRAMRAVFGPQPES